MVRETVLLARRVVDNSTDIVRTQQFNILQTYAKDAGSVRKLVQEIAAYKLHQRFNPYNSLDMLNIVSQITIDCNSAMRAHMLRNSSKYII